MESNGPDTRDAEPLIPRSPDLLDSHTRDGRPLHIHIWWQMNSIPPSLSLLNEAFAHRVQRIYFVTRFTQGEIENHRLFEFASRNAEILAFEFADGFGGKRDLLIGHTRFCFEVAWVDATLASIAEFAAQLNPEDTAARLEAGVDQGIGLFSSTSLFLPMDPIAPLQLVVQSFVVFEDLASNTIRGLHISFDHGVRFAMISGYYSEYQLLMNDHADVALQQARTGPHAAKFRLHEHSYFQGKPQQATFMATNPWLAE